MSTDNGKIFFTISKSNNIILRAKKTKSGYSLLLDIHHNKQRKHQYLGIYLTTLEKKRMTTDDRESLRIAELIKSKTIMDIASGDYDKEIDANIGLHDYLNSYIKKKENEKSRSLNKWYALAKHCNFFDEWLQLKNLTPRMLEDFKQYLLENLSINTASPYFSMLSTVLKRAYIEGIILSNPMDKLERKITRQQTQRTFLILEELKKLEDASCKNINVKKAFLFSCFTGLRWSDIVLLKGSQVRQEEGAYFLYFRQQKTSNIERLPLSQQAIKYLPGELKDNDLIFNIPGKRWTLDIIKDWAVNAGIKKNVSFHTARHTFATLALTYGVDIKTVSALLGHTEVRTTEIYAKIIDKKKTEAVEKLPEF